MAETRPRVATQPEKALARLITDLQRRVRTLELRPDPSGGIDDDFQYAARADGGTSGGLTTSGLVGGDIPFTGSYDNTATSGPGTVGDMFRVTGSTKIHAPADGLFRASARLLLSSMSSPVPERGGLTINHYDAGGSLITTYSFFEKAVQIGSGYAAMIVGSVGLPMYADEYVTMTPTAVQSNGTSGVTNWKIFSHDAWLELESLAPSYPAFF